VSEVRLKIPDLSGAPDVSCLEAACRRAGAIPKSDTVNRATAHRYFMAMVDRLDDLVEDMRLSRTNADVTAINAELAIIAKYFSGGFERRQWHGRPIDEVQLDRMDDAVEQVQRIRVKEGCTRDEAIWRLLERRGYGGRRDLFQRIRNYMNSHVLRHHTK
jgi:hypothetical protein